MRFRASSSSIQIPQNSSRNNLEMLSTEKRDKLSSGDSSMFSKNGSLFGGNSESRYVLCLNIKYYLKY